MLVTTFYKKLFYYLCYIYAKNYFFFACLSICIFNIPFLTNAQNTAYIDSLQNVVIKTKNDSVRCQIYFNIAQEYSQSLSDSAFKYNQKALVIASKLKSNRRMYADIHKQMIFDYLSFGKLAEAKAASDTALKIYIELKDEISQADVYDQTAYVYATSGKLSKQYDCIFRAIEIYEKWKNEEGKAFAYSHLGIAYVSNEQFIKALPYLHKALGMMDKQKNMQGISMAAGNIGYLYLQQGKYDSAEIYTRQSLRAGLKAHNWLSVLPALVDLARIHCHNKNYKAAEDTLTFALRKAETLQINYELSSILSGFGALYIATKDYPKALKAAEQLISIAKKTDDNNYEAEGYNILVSVYEAIGQPALALTYLKKHRLLSDTIWRDGNYEEITDLTIKYSINQKEKENILLKLNLERQKREQYIWMSSLLFLLLFAIGFGYLFWQRGKNLRSQKLLAQQERLIFEKENIILLQEQEQQEIKNDALQYEIRVQQEISRLEQEKMQESLDSKSRTLATLAIAMVQKNSILQDLKVKIGENWTSKSSFEAKIKGILSDIDNSMDMEDEWKVFKQHFEEVHPDFFVKLEKYCPDLTPHEIRFCTYIKMNISAKDIAQMMNVTNRAIQMNRHRIKKKLELGESIDFSTFVRTL